MLLPFEVFMPSGNCCVSEVSKKCISIWSTEDRKVRNISIKNHTDSPWTLKIST